MIIWFKQTLRERKIMKILEVSLFRNTKTTDIIAFYNKYPKYRSEKSPIMEIITYIEDRQVLLDDEVEFKGSYYLRGQTSYAHTTTGYGDCNYLRITAFRIYN